MWMDERGYTDMKVGSFITPTGSNTVIYSKHIHSKKHKTYQSETESSLWKSVSIYCTTKD